MPVSEYSKRNVYTVLLSNLKPGAVYTFRISDPSWINFKSKVYSYKTFDLGNMKILAGGDVGNREAAYTMNKNTVRNLDFDLIMIGGDVAYDNNVPTCYRPWDYFLINLPYDKYDPITDTTRIVPLLMSVGNHDMGVYSYAGVDIKHNTHEPVFKHWFPQHTSLGDLPSVQDRRSYYAQEFGDKLLIMSLDAGYESFMEGEQLSWIEQTMKESKAQIKMAQFHGPIITSFLQTAPGDFVVQDVGQKAWVPVFDKYNMTLVSENHSHVFMRSKLLKNMTEDPSGTLYIGEGSWGPKETNPEVVNKEYFEKTKAAQHVWLIEIDNSDQIKLTAYDEQKNVLDSLTLKY
jgi:hypothetical protein